MVCITFAYDETISSWAWMQYSSRPKPVNPHSVLLCRWRWGWREVAAVGELEGRSRKWGVVCVEGRSGFALAVNWYAVYE